jgi:glycosyltransferase involved in cell wall biosynthesis
MRRFCSDNRCQLWHASHDNAHEGQVWWTVALSRRTNRLSSRFRWRRNLEVALKAKLRPVIRAVRATVQAPGRLLLALTAPLARLAGACAGRIRKRKAARALFFLFPWDAMGGAEIVHVAIVESVEVQRPLLVFDLAPACAAALADRFNRVSDVWRLAGWLRDHPLAPLTRNFLAGYISAHRGAVVFGGNSDTFYDLAPLLPAHVTCIDLLHALRGGYVEHSLALAPRLNTRVIITPEIRDGLASLYRSAGYPASLLDRVVLIRNPNLLPVAGVRSASDGILRVLYVGRDGPEKRLELLAAVAEAARRRTSSPPHFTAIGDISPERLPGFECRGLIADDGKLSRTYLEHDVLLLTSSREGFPLAVTEAMNHGVIPVCTAVGGLPEMLNDGDDSFLFPPELASSVLVESIVDRLVVLTTDPNRRARMSDQARRKAHGWSDRGAFNAAYRRLLQPA